MLNFFFFRFVLVVVRVCVGLLWSDFLRKLYVV